MDRIEFKMQPEKRDFTGATMKRMLMSRIFRVYLIFFISTFLLLVILAEIYDGSGYENLISVLGFCCIAALVVPFLLPRELAKNAFKSYSKYGERLFFLDKEGYGAKSPTFEFFYKWQGFDTICETKNYLFMKRREGGHFVIFKRILSDKTISSIRAILADVQIPNKKMLADEKLK